MNSRINKRQLYENYKRQSIQTTYKTNQGEKDKENDWHTQKTFNQQGHDNRLSWTSWRWSMGCDIITW